MGAMAWRCVLLTASVGARSPRRVRHRLWHPLTWLSPSLLANQFYGGVVYAFSYASMIVSFDSCNITGNTAEQVSMRQTIIRRCMQPSGSFRTDAMASGGA